MVLSYDVLTNVKAWTVQGKRPERISVLNNASLIRALIAKLDSADEVTLRNYLKYIKSERANARGDVRASKMQPVAEP